MFGNIYKKMSISVSKLRYNLKVKNYIFKLELILKIKNCIC